MSKVEEAPKATEPKRPPSLPIKWKSFFVVLMIGLVVLAGVSYTQYQSLNRISAEYEQLKELIDLVEKGASLQSEYLLRYEFHKLDFTNFSKVDPITIPIALALPRLIYNPYDNSKLYLVLSISTILSESYVPISVQEGNVFDLGTNEVAPVIWSVNATASDIYSVPLASKGWYTLSLFGSIPKLEDNTIQYRIPVIKEDFDCRISLRIIYEGKYSPFIVTHGPH